LKGLPTPSALDLPVQKTNANAKREPEYSRQHPDHAVLGLLDMLARLETDHLRVVRRQQRRDDVTRLRVLVVVYGGACGRSGIWL